MFLKWSTYYRSCERNKLYIYTYSCRAFATERASTRFYTRWEVVLENEMVPECLSLISKTLIKSLFWFARPSRTFLFVRVACTVVVILVRREEGQGLHQLVTLADGYITVVQALRGFAVHVEPPVALQDRLIEQCRFGAQEALHDQAVVCQRANVEHLKVHGK